MVEYQAKYRYRSIAGPFFYKSIETEAILTKPKNQLHVNDICERYNYVERYFDATNDYRFPKKYRNNFVNGRGVKLIY